jgi:type IV secretion system protein VirD4
MLIGAKLRHTMAPSWGRSHASRGGTMKLKEGLRSTDFKPPRGVGRASVPDTGDQSLPASQFWTKTSLLEAPGLVYEPGRLFLGRVDQRMIGYRDNRHIVTVAGSRSGKSACLIIPNLLMYPGPALVIDPKGELAEATARRRAKDLGHKVVVLDPFKIAKGEATAFRAGHDPLSELSVDSGDLIDDAAAMGEALVVETGGDSYWTLAARNVLTGLILLAKLGAGNRSLSDLRTALASDPERLWAEMRAFGPDDDDPPVIREALTIIQSQGLSFQNRPPVEAGNVIATALEQLSFLQSPAMRGMFNAHEVGLSQLKSGHDDRPVTIFLVLPAGRVGTHSRWLRLMVTMALVHMERIASSISEHPVLMVLEEFAALGHLRPVERAAGFIAGAGVRLWSVLQDLAQLQEHYKATWETFIGNAGLLQAFSNADLTTCKYLSDKLGEMTVEVTNTVGANAQMQLGGDFGTRREFRSVALLSPAEIGIEFARRSDGRGGAAGGPTLVLVPGAHPFSVDRVHHTELEE